MTKTKYNIIHLNSNDEFNKKIVLCENENICLILIANGEGVNINLDITSAANSSLTNFIFALSSNNLKCKINNNLTGANSNAYFYSAYAASKSQTLKFDIQNTHIANNCQSDIAYNGILVDEFANVDWVCNTTIEKDAINTNTYEINKNIVFAKNNKVQSIPNLEIKTGEIVRAGHASTIGKIDPEKLFYLNSRGLDKIQSARLIMNGFWSEIINKLPSSDEQTIVEKEISEKIEEICQSLK